jgi:hypothetical protein
VITNQTESWLLLRIFATENTYTLLLDASYFCAEITGLDAERQMSAKRQQSPEDS